MLISVSKVLLFWDTYIIIFIIVCSGGIDSSAYADNADKDSVQQVLCDSSDDEIDQLFGTADEERADRPSASKEQSENNRRAKIAKFLKDEKDKRMVPKQSVNKQHLNIAKEDLALKRKIMESSEKVDQEFLNNTSKMAKSMESVSRAIADCFDLMKKMHELPQQQPMHYNASQAMPSYPNAGFGYNQFYSSNCFNIPTINTPSVTNKNKKK